MLYFLLLLIQVPLFSKITESPVTTMGGDSRSVNWFDFDRDQDLDLFISNGKDGGENNFFYLNTGNGNFVFVDSLIICKDGSPSDGATAGDINNDGYTDLFVSTWYGYKNFLYLNDQGKLFIQQDSSPAMKDLTYAETGTFGDANRDGWLDLYVTISAGNLRNILYLNDGTGGLVKQSITGTLSPRLSSRYADFADLNADGWQDLVVTNEYGQAENLFLNGPSGFTSSAPPSLSGLGGNTAGGSIEDVDNDGDFDLILANYNGERNHLLIHDGNLGWVKKDSAPWTEDPANSFGTAPGDVDNDGDLDLLITNAFAPDGSRLVNYLYLNDGHGNFTRSETGLPADSGWVYGAAFADYDLDGDLDAALAGCFGKTENNRLYRNDGNGNHWIQLDLTGTLSNRSGIGALVHLYSQTNGTTLHQTRRMAGQSGYSGQTLRIHAGLGDATVLDSLVIFWPSGIRQSLIQVQADQLLSVTESASPLSVPADQPGRPFRINQIYPNPFNPETTVGFSVDSDLQGSSLSVSVFDLTGRLVQSDQIPVPRAGTYSWTFSAGKFSSGSYLVRLSSGTRQDSRWITLVK
ncbi:MAG: FG-GAP-like repeat-containing protein [Bacteroidetes bacterium]|nr:FG-GAP-like repeat-containing protein [Bacteroidota bacterium]